MGESGILNHLSFFLSLSVRQVQGYIFPTLRFQKFNQTNSFQQYELSNLRQFRIRNRLSHFLSPPVSKYQGPRRGGAGRAIALPLFCRDLFSRAPIDMGKVLVELLDFSDPKRWTVRASCFGRILENQAVLMEEWDVCLSERLEPDVRERIIGCKT